jgi:hypothetical protein
VPRQEDVDDASDTAARGSKTHRHSEFFLLEPAHQCQSSGAEHHSHAEARHKALSQPQAPELCAHAAGEEANDHQQRSAVEHCTKEAEIDEPADGNTKSEYETQLCAADPGDGRGRRSGKIYVSEISLEQAKSIADAPAVSYDEDSSEGVKPGSATVERLDWSRGKRFVFYRKGRGGTPVRGVDLRHFWWDRRGLGRAESEDHLGFVRFILALALREEGCRVDDGEVAGSERQAVGEPVETVAERVARWFDVPCLDGGLDFCEGDVLEVAASVIVQWLWSAGA